MPLLSTAHHTDCSVGAEARRRWYQWVWTILVAGLFLAFTGPLWVPLLSDFRSLQQLDPRLKENWWWVGFLAGSCMFYATQAARWLVRRFVRRRAEVRPGDR
jgi:drug/metabolite transporter (DMT)-like permease